MIDISGPGSSGSAVLDTRWLGHTMALGSEAHGLYLLGRKGCQLSAAFTSVGAGVSGPFVLVAVGGG